MRKEKIELRSAVFFFLFKKEYLIKNVCISTSLLIENHGACAHTNLISTLIIINFLFNETCLLKDKFI